MKVNREGAKDAKMKEERKESLAFLACLAVK